MACFVSVGSLAAAEGSGTKKEAGKKQAAKREAAQKAAAKRAEEQFAKLDKDVVAAHDRLPGRLGLGLICCHDGWNIGNASPSRESLRAVIHRGCINRRRAANLRLPIDLFLLIGAARCQGLVGAAEGLLDIALEIIVEDREGPGEAGEVLLRDEQE